MSGPWDRPSSPSRDDPDWPASDLEAPARDSSAADPWSSEDPWSESPRDPAPAWDVWPSPAPADVDYAIDQPEPPSSDPWAESWTDEAPDVPFGTDHPAESPAPQPSGLTDAPRVEPWAPDEDPWGAATAEPWRPAEPWREEQAEPPPVEPAWVEPPIPDPDLDATPESEFEMPAHRSTDLPKEVGLIGVPVEPALEPGMEEPDRRSDEVVEPAWEVDPWAPAPAEEAGAVEAEPEPLHGEQLVSPAPGPAPEVEPESEPRPDAEVQPEPEPEPQPEPEPEREQEREPEPQVEPEPAALPVEQPQAEPQPALLPEEKPQPEPWPERGESTQVLPTTWRPPPPPVRQEAADLEPAAGPVRTALAGREEAEETELARPSTAEQAVPWLIGAILLLAGMVIVLMALIFAGDDSLGGGAAVPSESALALVRRASSVPAPSPTATPNPRATATADRTEGPTSVATPSPEPWPAYGALEMIYQGRSTALAPIYLLKRDFAIVEEPTVFAQDPNLDVRRFAWAPDGTVGAGLLANVLVSIEPGKEKRRLGDDISTITFGDDAGVVYAVRVEESGANDVATVLAIDFATGDARDVASVTYPRPVIGEEDALAEAQFADEGGVIRLAWMEDDALHLWSLGAGSWRIEPGDGTVTKLDGANPVLWSPDGERRITLTASGATTTIRVHSGADAEPIATTSVSGRVSHVRWSPGGERVTFTLGRSASGGGVLQDLFLWDLADGEAPTKLTSTGAAFGAEWRGSQPLWREP